MAVRTKSWDWRHSIWLIWMFFSLGIFNGTSFIYIGIRTRQRKWIYWGMIYSLPFVLFVILVEPNSPPNWLSNSLSGLFLAMWIASIIHAFMIRNEYLERLWYLKQKEQEELEQLRKRIRQEYEGEGAGRPSSDRTPSSPPEARPISRNSPLIDLNRASEEELASLPGMNLILAKNAIKKRSEKGGFSSVEDFAHSLGLKPHVTERIRRLATVRPLPDSSGPDEIFPDGKGRIVDF